MKQAPLARRRQPISESSAVAQEIVEVDSLLRSLGRDLFFVYDSTSALPLRQLHVCMTLFDGPLTMSQLSQKLGCSLSAMTQIGDRLERAGFVARVADETDRRVRCLTLTTEGHRALQAHQKIQQNRLAAAYSCMSEPARRKLVAGLKHLQAACADAMSQVGRLS